LSNFTLPASSDTAILFDSLNEMPFSGGMVDPLTTPSHEAGKLTCPAGGDGIYMVSGFVSINQANVPVWIRKNGSERVATQNSGASTAGFGSSRSVSSLISLVAGDYLELVATVGGSPASTVRFDFNSFFNTIPNFWAQWMRGL
jgi:hypothetical protein